jgi:hypothetical protein
MGGRFRPWGTLPLVRDVSTRPASDPLSKSQARRTHVTGSTKIGPISIRLRRPGQREPLRLYDPTQEGESIMSAKFRLAMTGLIVLSAFTRCSEEDTPSPPPSVVTVETASPTPSSTAHPSASTKPKRAHSQAKFDHFMVTVDDLERVNSSEVRLLAKVCVRSLPPDPQGKRTRISWDPWSVRARAKMIDADPAHATFKGAFPPDDIYRVGQCASGWIPFLARGSVTKIKYSNGVGDGAVWDADHLDRKPEIRAKRSPTPQKPTPPTRGNVHQGAFCTPEGATGRTSAGTPMVCKGKHGDQPRWVRQ